MVSFLIKTFKSLLDMTLTQKPLTALYRGIQVFQEIKGLKGQKVNQDTFIQKGSKVIKVILE